MARARANPEGGKYTIRRGRADDEVGNYTIADVRAADLEVTEAMAKHLWEDCLITLREQRTEDGDELDVDEALGSDPPAACFSAARAALTLWAAANHIGNPSMDNELSLEVFNDAMEIGDLSSAEAALRQINSVPFVFAVLAHRVNQDQSFGIILFERLGYYLYMEAVGHGVDWGDSPNSWKDFPRERPLAFEVNISVNDLCWSGRHGALSVSDCEDTEWEFGEDEARPDEHRIVTYYRVTDSADAQVLEEGYGQDPGNGSSDGELLDRRSNERTWVDAAVRFLREHDVDPALTRPAWAQSAGNLGFPFRSAPQDIDDTQIQQIEFGLRGFSEEEGREVYARFAPPLAAPHVIRTYDEEREPSNGDLVDSNENEVELEPDEDETFVQQAVKMLRYDGASEASSSPTWSTGTYMTQGDQDYRTGNLRQRTFHLEGFTPEEEQQVYDLLMRRR